LPILRITDGARGHCRPPLHMKTVNDALPFLKTMRDAIHRLRLQAFRLIDAFAEPKNPSLCVKRFQGTGRGEVGNEQSAGERANVDTRKSLIAHSASRMSCISASSFFLVSFNC
jgi:hypothetical protein